MSARDTARALCGANTSGPGTLAWMLAAQEAIARESDDKWADLDRILTWDPHKYRARKDTP